jgi:ABC-2 type transport system permease protein
MGLFNIVSLNLYEFGDVYIVEGKFDRVLLRPVPPLFQILFETFRLESLQEVIIGALVVGYCAARLGMSWSALDLLLFPALALCGAVIYTGVFVIITSVNFWIEDRIGLAPPVYNMIPFGRYPISIYNPIIQFLLNWIIPFAFASFYPTVRFLGRREFEREFLLVPAVAIALAVLAGTIWNRGVRRYESTGS